MLVFNIDESKENNTSCRNRLFEKNVKNKI